jgi:hypothetical protein
MRPCEHIFEAIHLSLGVCLGKKFGEEKGGPGEKSEFGKRINRKRKIVGGPIKSDRKENVGQMEREQLKRLFDQ